MASLTEFYLTTLWAYKPETVRQVVDGIARGGYEQAEFTYDNDYCWFKVTCLQKDADKIRRNFAAIACDIEETAFDEYEDDMLEFDDDTLKESFDNKWFSHTSSDQVSWTDESYCRPQRLITYSHVKAWDDLDKTNEPYTIRDIIMGPDDLQQIREDLGVGFTLGTADKLIHIGGYDEESVCKAVERFKIMLALRKLLGSPLRAQNIVYVEDYVDPVTSTSGSKTEFKTDIRYLANIDPKLPISTLLDRATVTSLEDSYKILYRQGCSLRLCPWAPDKGYHVSLLGPKVVVKKRKWGTLENRPTISLRRLVELPVATAEAGLLTQNRGRTTTGQVENWIDRLPVQAGPVRGTTHSILDGQAAGGSSALPMSEDLLDFTDESSTCCETPTAAATQNAANDISSLSRGLSALQVAPGTLNTEPMSSMQFSELAFTGDGCLIDMLAAVKTVGHRDAPTSSIDWRMPPLIPLPQSDQQHSQQGTTGSPNNDSHVNQSTNHVQDLTKKATGSFINDIEAAMVKSLSVGPYRRGRFAVRAELGRVILEIVDERGLAFNAANTPSNGWDKKDLIKALDHYYGGDQGIRFTNVLSTYGCDMEGLINTEANGTRLWEQNPSRAWTTYSFYCSLRSTELLLRFIVDIEDDGNSNFSYSIRPTFDTPSLDKPMPIYIHAIRRHWDLRIVTPHVKTENLGEAYDSFAKFLLESLSVFKTGSGSLHLKFAVPADSAVDVNEVRVLTKWRHASIDNKSALEITEALQLETARYSEGIYADAWNSHEGRIARPWVQETVDKRKARGEVPRWYEAAVVSPELEDLCHQNQNLRAGQKADWDAEDLRERGILSAIYRPALQMVQAMDHVGRLDSNNLSGMYSSSLLKPNNPARHVPGSSFALTAQVGNPVRQQGRRRGAASEVPTSDTTSSTSGTTSAYGSSAYQGRRGPTQSEANLPDGFW